MYMYMCKCCHGNCMTIILLHHDAKIYNMGAEIYMYMYNFAHTCTCMGKIIHVMGGQKYTCTVHV